MKASYDVKQGDEITIGFGNRSVSVRVLDIKETVRKEDVDSLYEYI